VDFPHEEVILGATPASLRETLDRICFVLTDDRSKKSISLCRTDVLGEGYQLRAASGSIGLFAEGTAPRSGGTIADWMRSGFDVGTVEANPELTRPIAHQMYLPTPVVFTTGVTDAGDRYVVASGEVDPTCRTAHIPKALFA
jgi:hypothetical protein